MTEICEVVITAPEIEWLVDLTHRLIEQNLCASGHHIEQIRSVYRWHGEVYDKRESRVALHTRSALVSTIVDLVNTEHPYEVPCVIALPITTANPAYAQWVEAETRGATVLGVPAVPAVPPVPESL